MKALISTIALLISVVYITLSFNGCAAPAQRITGPIPQEAYVWQRSWDGAVQESLIEASLLHGGLVILGAEVSFNEGRLRSINVAVDYDSLRELEIPVGIALRIGPYPGPFSEEDDTASILADMAVQLLEDAKASGLSIKELQLDFDCAESKLDGYRKWVNAIRREIEPTPLTITALPCWLRHREFKKLAEAADGYVLQVHSLERPKSINDIFTLCDPERAKVWIEQAARLGIPFRVALPTYGYLVAFDAEGKFIGLSAEGPLREWPEDTQLREIRANPNEMSTLVADIKKDRPANLGGIIWYRLPVQGDRLNWPWPTLAAIMEGRTPRTSLNAVARKPEPALVDVELINDGETDEPPRVIISVNWVDAHLIAWDTLRGFELIEMLPSGVKLQGPVNPIQERINPAESWLVGWFRFDQDTEVEVDVLPIQD